MNRLVPQPPKKGSPASRSTTLILPTIRVARPRVWLNWKVLITSSSRASSGRNVPVLAGHRAPPEGGSSPPRYSKWVLSRPPFHRPSLPASKVRKASPRPDASNASSPVPDRNPTPNPVKSRSSPMPRSASFGRAPPQSPVSSPRVQRSSPAPAGPTARSTAATMPRARPSATRRRPVRDRTDAVRSSRRRRVQGDLARVLRQVAGHGGREPDRDEVPGRGDVQALAEDAALEEVAVVPHAVPLPVRWPWAGRSGSGPSASPRRSRPS